MLLAIFHLSVVLINGFTLWYDQRYGTLPLKEDLKGTVLDLPFKGRGLFLTIWCLVLQTVYFTLSLLNDLFGATQNSKKPPLIKIMKDTLFSLAFPVAIIVGTAFWSVYSYDKDLILPEEVRKVFPDWMNHVMHSTIVLFVILELSFSPITYPPRKIGIPLGLLFIAGYVGLLATIYLKAGTLIYPFLDAMSVPNKIAFISATSFIGICVYFLGETLNKLLNPIAKDSGKSSSKPSAKKHKKRV